MTSLAQRPHTDTSALRRAAQLQSHHNVKLHRTAIGTAMDNLSSHVAADEPCAFQEDQVVLIGDVGGTNCRLELWQLTGDRKEKLFSKTYGTDSFPTFQAAVESFLTQLPSHCSPSFAALAVAGVVRDSCCHMTNCTWIIDGPQLTQKFRFRFAVLNDFEAAGYGITSLQTNQLVPLNPHATQHSQGPKLCIGPGTGLGVVQVVWDSGMQRYVVLPSEGGHATFGPRTPSQRNLQQWVEDKEGFCDIEQVSCGKGLLRIYNFLCDGKGRDSKFTMPSEVTAAANEGEEDAVDAMHMFMDILGAAAGNGAMQLLATGGVYIAGGITPKVLNWMRMGRLLDAFLYPQNRKFSGLLRSFPLFCVDTEELGLIGCRTYAIDALRDNILLALDREP